MAAKRRGGGEAARPLVLVVEDDRETRDGYADLLALEGFAVRDVGTAAEAFDQILACVPDVILLDIRLPDSEGWALCRELNGDPRTRHVPIVVATGLDPVPRAPCDTVLTKPVAPDALVSELRRALDKAAPAALSGAGR
jgi:CheY-like chemotaxis protein